MNGLSDPSSLRKPASESIHKELEHIRLVHFALLITSATLAYVVLSLHVFSLRPLLVEDLSHLQGLLNEIANGDSRDLAYAWSDVPTGGRRRSCRTS